MTEEKWSDTFSVFEDGTDKCLSHVLRRKDDDEEEERNFLLLLVKD